MSLPYLSCDSSIFFSFLRVWPYCYCCIALIVNLWWKLFLLSTGFQGHVRSCDGIGYSCKVMTIGWGYGRGWNGCHSNCKHLHCKLIPTILSRIDKKSIIVSMLFLSMFWRSRGGLKQFQSSHDSLIQSSHDSLIQSSHDSLIQSSHDSLIHLFIGPWRSFFLSVWWSFCLEN